LWEPLTKQKTDWPKQGLPFKNAWVLARIKSNFNLMAVIPDKRIGAEDQQLAQETAKREEWKLENQRRRQNYVPLCVQLLKELARQEKLPELIQQATEGRQKQKG
jgi:hypothetical protein